MMTSVSIRTHCVGLGAIAFLAALVALSAGCGLRHGVSATPGSTPNVFRMPMNDTPSTFDPAMVEDGMTIDILQQVFEGLVQWTPQNTLAPALAQSWTVSPDGRTYTFKIRDGVKFQDGNPMTAQDVAYSFARSLSPQLRSPVALTYMGDIVGAADYSAGKSPALTGVKIIDDHTLAVTINKPKAYWIYSLTYPTSYVVSRADAVPTRVMTDADVEKGAGTGPFRLTSYVPDQRVEMGRNSAYWGGAPHIAGQERLIVKDADTRHALYVSGKLDLVDENQGDLQADSSDPTLRGQLHYWPRAATWYLALGENTVPAFRDVRVRQALAMATDKEKIRKVAFSNIVDVAQDILPDGIPGYDPSFQGLPYDPARARALLASAGYPGGRGLPVIPLAYRQSDPSIEKAVDLIRQMWHDNLGVTVQGVRTQWSVLLDEDDRGVLKAWFIRWMADYLDPQDYYSVLLHSGSAEDHEAYSNPKYDALCDAADGLQSLPRRVTLYRKAARIVADDAPVIPLYYQRDVELVKPYVRGIDDSLMGHLPYKNLTLQ
ncbi:MAG: ABC transporter substrate-binding protein [Capsulimonadaceae bacterium]